jgi:REP element-mobilizing transposase RayT
MSDIKKTNGERMEFYRRNLPHWQPMGAEFFITFRLAGSFPKEAVELLKNKRKEFRENNRNSDLTAEERGQFDAEIFKTYEHLLDNPSSGPVWLSNKNVAEIVVDSIHFYDEQNFELYAFSIMSNHVHLVIRHIKENYDVDLPVTGIMKLIKSYTGKECNKILKRSGQFWQSESYDRVIRDQEELEKVIQYTLNNPVNAKLVKNWREWPFTYCKPEFVESK